MNQIVPFAKITKKASETLLVRFPATLTFAVFPPSVGLFLFFFSNPSPPEGNFWFQIHSLQDSFLNDYILGLQIGLVLTVAFFVTFRWNQMIKDRSYGYWLSQGVDRSQFLAYSSVQFLGIIFLGIVFGQAIVIYPGGIQLHFIQNIRMVLILFSSALLIYSMALLIAEIVKEPEIGLLVFVGLGLLSSSIEVSSAGLLQMTFLSNRFILGSLSLQPLMLPIVTGSIFMVFSYLLHKRRDINL